MQSLDEFASGKLAAWESVTVRRRLAVTRRAGGAATGRNGCELISVSCSD
jgi:8-amino-7-oxononanoate synthase